MQNGLHTNINFKTILIKCEFIPFSISPRGLRITTVHCLGLLFAWRAGLSPSSGAKTRIRDAKVQLLMIGSVNTSSMHRSQLTLFRSRILDLIKINMMHQLWALMVARNNIFRVENSDRGVHFYVGLEFRGLVLVLWLFVDTQQCIICKQCKCRYCRYVDI